MRSMDDFKAMIHRHDTESPEETVAPAGEGSAGATPAAPPAVLAGRQMTAGEQVKAVARSGLRHGWRRFHDARQHRGGLINYLYEYQARSVHQQADYARSRRWVPVGHDGGVAEGLGMWYHKWISLPGTAILQAAGAIQYPSIFALYVVIPFLAVFVPLAVLLISQFGFFAGFFAAAGVVAVLVVLLALLASAVLVSKEGHSR